MRVHVQGRVIKQYTWRVRVCCRLKPTLYDEDQVAVVDQNHCSAVLHGEVLREVLVRMEALERALSFLAELRVEAAQVLRVGCLVPVTRESIRNSALLGIPTRVCSLVVGANLLSGAIWSTLISLWTFHSSTTFSRSMLYNEFGSVGCWRIIFVS